MNSRDSAKADERATNLAEHRGRTLAVERARQEERDLARRRCTAVDPVTQWVEDPEFPGCSW